MPDGWILSLVTFGDKKGLNHPDCMNWQASDAIKCEPKPQFSVRNKVGHDIYGKVLGTCVFGQDSHYCIGSKDIRRV